MPTFGNLPWANERPLVRISDHDAKGSSGKKATMSAEENKARFLWMVDELNKGHVDFINEAFSPNFMLSTPTTPGWPRGLEGARKMITQLRAHIADLHATVEDILAEGDKVAIRWTFRGAYQGEARTGFPNPGEPITVVAISFYRFVNGKIEDDWGVDSLWQQPGDAWR
jgi:predicted ester cyclase